MSDAEAIRLAASLFLGGIIGAIVNRMWINR